MSGEAIYKPVTRATTFQGVANNEAQISMFADVARTQFGVDGTGVNIGVLSNSVSQFAGGLPDSYKTGDPDPNNPVKVLQDGPAGSTDEGRAMLENIHDIAPVSERVDVLQQYRLRHGPRLLTTGPGPARGRRGRFRPRRRTAAKQALAPA